MAGDFNAILELAEKRGGAMRLEQLALLMHGSISSLHLVDIKPRNGQFTWNNRRIGDDCIVERLDHFLVSYFWVGGGCSTYTKILDWMGPYHWFIKLFYLLCLDLSISLFQVSTYVVVRPIYV